MQQMMPRDREALLDEIALSDDPAHLAQLRHVIAREHAGDSALGTLLEWIAVREQMLERERTRDPGEAFARPYQRTPMSPERCAAFVARIRGSRTADELASLMRGIQSAYGPDVRWPALREEGRKRLGQLDTHDANQTWRSALEGGIS